jgi:hypothetical protein
MNVHLSVSRLTMLPTSTTPFVTLLYEDGVNKVKPTMSRKTTTKIDPSTILLNMKPGELSFSMKVYERPRDHGGARFVLKFEIKDRPDIEACYSAPFLADTERVPLKRLRAESILPTEEAFRGVVDRGDSQELRRILSCPGAEALVNHRDGLVLKPPCQVVSHLSLV